MMTAESLSMMANQPIGNYLKVESDIQMKYGDSTQNDHSHDHDNSQFFTKSKRVGLQETAALEVAVQALITATLSLEEAFLSLNRVFPDLSTAEPIITKISQPLEAARINAVGASTLLEEAILIWKQQFSTSMKCEPMEHDIHDDIDFDFVDDENLTKDTVNNLHMLDVKSEISESAVKVECKDVDSDDGGGVGLEPLLDLHSCEHCPYTTTTKKQLRIHSKSHKGEFKCTECEVYSADTSKKLKLHMSSKHPEQVKVDEKFHCQDCDYVTGRAKNLRRHRAARHEGIRYSCDMCDYSALWKGNLEEHKSTKHLGIRYNCDQCELSFTLRRNLRDHIKAKHGSIKSEHSCNICQFTTKTVEEIRSHIQLTHGEKLMEEFSTKSKNEGVIYSCDHELCNFTTANKLSLSSHKKRHSEMFYCDQCEYSSWNKLLLKRHHQTKHDKITINCDECDFKTTVIHYLTKHKKKMHRINKFQCDKCNFTCCYPSDLRNHINAVHLGVKLSCDHCEFTTRRTGDLNKHKKVVHGIEPYNCKHCPYTATQSRFLEEHIRMKHSDIYPFQEHDN